MSYKMIDAAQSPWLAVGATTAVTIARSCEVNGSQSVSRAPQRLSVSERSRLVRARFQAHRYCRLSMQFCGGE